MKPFSSACWLRNLEVLWSKSLSNVMSYLRFEFRTSNGFPKSPSWPCQRLRPVSFLILSLHIPMYLSGPSENRGVSLPTGDGWSLVGNVHDCSCYCYCEVRMRRGERGGRGEVSGEGRGRGERERWGQRGVGGHNYGIKILGGGDLSMYMYVLGLCDTVSHNYVVTITASLITSLASLCVYPDQSGVPCFTS